MPELVFYRSGTEVIRVALTRQRVIIGREDTSDIVLPDPDVSPQQVALHLNGTRCVVEDLSGQGTRVANKLTKHGELPDGEVLELGPWRAIYLRRSASRGQAPNSRPTDVKALESLREKLPPAQVRVKQGPNELLFEVGEDSFTVGTAASNTVVLKERFISSKHLEVTRLETGFRVRDLNSTNGTYAGAYRVHDLEVPLNTVLRVGELELIFEAVPGAGGEPGFHGLVGNEPAMRQLVGLIQQVAKSSAAVMVLGESGTGKELAARAVHACSPRVGGPFIALSCADLARGVTESELFGHEKGAFTGAEVQRKGAFEEADGGTLFLDEVGELPLDLQTKLLRVLERGEVKRVGASRPVRVDVRVVAATNRDLPAEVREGRFREDLYYRLCGVPVVLPPLRNRRGDIRLLAEHFVREFSPSDVELKLTVAALAALEQHPWPGNVRELRNAVFQAVLLRKGSKIDVGDLAFEPKLQRAPKSLEDPDLDLPEGVTLEQWVQRFERRIVETELRKCNYHKDKAAKRLGIARSSLFKRLKDWGMSQREE